LFGLAPAPARASDVELFSPDTLSGSADVRTIAANGERSWERGDFGKLRYGDEAGPRLGNADLVWQPKFGWVLSATVTASALGGPRPEAGMSEAFFTVRPRLAGSTRAWARIGFVWAPASLEHEGADWHVAETVTPSAINSWIGEEVRPLAAEANLDFAAGDGRMTATAAMFTANDTAGALLALRGWALHDRKTLIGHAQPIPPLSKALAFVQPRYTHPTLYLGEGFARRPGYYLKLAWAPAAPFRVEAFRYVNRADPEDFNAELEWGWDTQFNQVAGELHFDQATAIKVQALAGRSRMGFTNAAGRIWVDSSFRSAFGLLTRHFSRGGAALRGEVFETTQRGRLVTAQDSEKGWAATLAAHRELGHALSLWVEVLHIESHRQARTREALDPEQRQNQLQFVLRGRW
jgi:hypothetical protein